MIRARLELALGKQLLRQRIAMAVLHLLPRLPGILLTIRLRALHLLELLEELCVEALLAHSLHESSLRCIRRRLGKLQVLLEELCHVLWRILHLVLELSSQLLGRHL